MLDDYLGPIWTGAPFKLFDPSHIGLLVTIAILTVAVLVLGPRIGERGRTIVRHTAGWFLILNSVVWHVWNLTVGLWSLQGMLPLHLCSIMSFVTAIGLFTGQPLLAALAWLLGTPGALAALVMSEVAPFGFPHYRVLQSWTQHGLLWLAGFWLVFVELLRPDWRRLVQAWLVLHAYAAVVFGINVVLGSNYLFMNRKPEFATILSVLSDWPGYLLALEGLVVVIMLVFWLTGQSARRARPSTRQGEPQPLW